MSNRGQRDGIRWGLAVLAACTFVTSVQAQQTVGSSSDEQGGFVVIGDTQPPPPAPKPMTLPAIVPPHSVAAAVPLPHFEPVPELPRKARLPIKRTPPVTKAPNVASHVPSYTPVGGRPGHPATAFAVTAVAVTKPNPAAEPYMIPAGTMISAGLAKYVQRFGWSMRWLVENDYRLDAPLPIPAGTMKAGVTYVVNAYQSQGGLLGDVPRFADPNKVVVIQPVTAARARSLAGKRGSVWRNVKHPQPTGMEAHVGKEMN